MEAIDRMANLEKAKGEHRVMLDVITGLTEGLESLRRYPWISIDRLLIRR